MRVLTTASVLALMTLGATQAQAAGCIKGAIIGGVAGHYLADRGVVGAVAGCLGGRYLAKRQARGRDIEYQRSGSGRGYDRGYDRRGYGY